MNRLLELRYLPVFLRQVEGAVLLFNPNFAHEWRDNEQFLQTLIIPEMKGPYLINHYFPRLALAMKDERTPKAADIGMDEIRQSLQQFALGSSVLPAKVTVDEYYSFMNGCYQTVTERLFSRHTNGHVASARHALLKTIQLKGVGRTASTHQLSHPNLTGFVPVMEAYRSYYNAQLLANSLPLGGMDVQAILAIKDKMITGLVVRSITSHRLAQIEPIFMRDEEKEVLRQEMLYFHGNSSVTEILEKIVEQHLCLWLMGVEHNFTVDNLALSGQALDEEDMRPASSIKLAKMCFYIKLETEHEMIETWEQLQAHTFQARLQLNECLLTLIQYYSEIYTWLGGGTFSLADSQPLIDRQMQCVLERLYHVDDVKCFMQVWRSLSKKIIYGKDELVMIGEQLKQAGWQFECKDQIYQHRLTTAYFNLPMRLKDDLRGRYNVLERRSADKLLQSFMALGVSMDNGDVAQVSNSSHIHHFANLQSFSLCQTRDIKLADVSLLVRELSGSEQVSDLEVYGPTGLVKLAISEWQNYLQKHKECIVVQAMMKWEGNSFYLPVKKTPLRLID